jgi:hypothetical protein
MDQHLQQPKQMPPQDDTNTKLFIAFVTTEIHSIWSPALEELRQMFL